MDQRRSAAQGGGADYLALIAPARTWMKKARAARSARLSTQERRAMRSSSFSSGRGTGVPFLHLGAPILLEEMKAAG